MHDRSSTAKIQQTLQPTSEQLAAHHDLIRKRQEDIEQIAGDVKTINEMFQQLHGMVVEQDKLIENIEANVNKSRQDTNEALEQIKKAQKAQSDNPCKLL